jgi:putative endonuclease
VEARNLARGALGEEMAVRHLTRMGWRILGRNVRYPFGEIDIVAHDGTELVFVEVRLRGPGPQRAAETVGPAKLRKLIRACRAFAESRGYDGPFRIDLLAIDQGPCGYRVELIRDVTGG